MNAAGLANAVPGSPVEVSCLAIYWIVSALPVSNWLASY